MHRCAPSQDPHSFATSPVSSLHAASRQNGSHHAPTLTMSAATQSREEFGIHPHPGFTSRLLTSTTSALAPPGHAEPIRGGMLCTDPPSVRTRRDKVHPTPPHRPNDNVPPQRCRTGGRHFAQLLPRGVAPLASRICDQNEWFAGVGGLRLVRSGRVGKSHFRPPFCAAPAGSTTPPPVHG